MPDQPPQMLPPASHPAPPPTPPAVAGRMARAMPWVDLLAKVLTALAMGLAVWRGL